MTCENITFATANHLPDSTITAAPEPVTDIGYLKTEFPAEVGRFTDFSNPQIVITGTHDADVYADYYAIIGSNLTADATVKLELFADDESTTDLLQMDAGHVGSLIPLGLWRAGIDGYNVRQGADANHVFVVWFDQMIKYKRWVLTIAHGYELSEEEIPNDIRQESSAGVFSIEAESCDVAALGASTWELTADATASGGQCLKKVGGGFYPTAGTGPSFTTTYKAHRSGTHKVWVRVKSNSDDSFFVDVNGGTELVQFLGLADGNWHWIHARSVSTPEDTEIDVTVYAREDQICIDKIVVQLNALAAPTDLGPDESDFGFETVTGNTETVDIRMLMMGQRLQLERNYNYGYITSGVTSPKLVQTDSGRYVQAGEQYKSRSCSLNLDMMTDGDRMRLSNMEETLLGEPFILASHKGHGGWFYDQNTYLARFVDKLDYSHNFIDRHSTSLTISEV